MTNPIADIIRNNSRPLDPIPTGTTPVLKKLPGIRAVLFDVYGTLFISGSGEVGTVTPVDQGDALSEVLAAAGLENIPAGLADRVKSGFLQRIIEELHRESKDAGIEYPEVDIVDVWRSLLAGKQDEEFLRRLAAEYEVRTNPVWPMPGVVDCLHELAAKGLTLGIISNAQFYTRELFPALLDVTAEDLAFDEQVQYYSYRTGEAKPGLSLYRQAAETLKQRGIDAGGALYVGNDMLNDVMPAARIGFRTALFAGDRRSLRRREDDPRVDGVEPDLVVTDLTSIVECVV